VQGYSLYGLRLGSDLPFPELPADRAAADVTLALGPIDIDESQPAGRRNWFRSSPDEVSMHLDRVGTVRILRGREILVDPEHPIEEERLRAFLLGPVFSLLLVQRGHFPLHASAVAIQGRAVAIAAPSGGGKSTTAAALLARGHRLLADDVTALRLDGATPLVLPGYPFLKLTEESLRRLGRSPDGLPRVHPEEDRYLFRPEGAFRGEPIPLSKIYLLDQSPPVGVERIEAQEAFRAVVLHCHRLGLLRNTLGAAGLMARSTRIAGSVPVYRFRVRYDAESPHDVAGRVEAHALS